MDREKLPDTRKSVTHKAVILAEGSRVKFFFTVGFYPDGRPGELFLHMDEGGSTLDGFADAWSIAVSLCLQSGVSLETLVNKFSFQEFEPKGMTDCPEVQVARSVVDYVVRWMEKGFKI
jgi:ribonucleoside-diphosphate reductase alpha chain